MKATPLAYLNAPSDQTLASDDASYHLNQTLSDTRWTNIPGWHVFRYSFISI